MSVNEVKKLANEFYSLFPRCDPKNGGFVGVKDAANRMLRIRLKCFKDILRKKYDIYIDNYYDCNEVDYIHRLLNDESEFVNFVAQAVEGTEFDNSSAVDIRIKKEEIDEIAELVRIEQREIDLKCSLEEYEKLKADDEQLLADEISGLSVENAERFEYEFRAEREHYYNSMFIDYGTRYNDTNDRINRNIFVGIRDYLIAEYRSFLRQEKEEKERQNNLLQEKLEKRKLTFDRRDKGMTLNMNIKIGKGGKPDVNCFVK